MNAGPLPREPLRVVALVRCRADDQRHQHRRDAGRAQLADRDRAGTADDHVAVGEALRFAALSRILHFRVIDWPSEGRETTNTGAVLDRDRLRAPLELRNWRPGDAMRPAGHQNRHTVARFLNELGASRWEKESWPVLTSAGKLAWVLGLPVAHEFAMVEGSRAAVVITEESSS